MAELKNFSDETSGTTVTYPQMQKTIFKYGKVRSMPQTQSTLSRVSMIMLISLMVYTDAMANVQKTSITMTSGKRGIHSTKAMAYSHKFNDNKEEKRTQI